MAMISQNENLRNPVFSEIIKKKLLDVGGSTEIKLFSGKTHFISTTGDGFGFATEALHKKTYEFRVFDIVADLLLNNGGKAGKGSHRNYKLGDEGCGASTVRGAIAIHYDGKKLGKSVFDPVFIIAAILEWAGICKNCRGYIELKS